MAQAERGALGANHVTVVTGREFKEDSDEYDQGLQTYAGAGDQLVRGPFVPVLGANEPVVLTPTVDGGGALTWPGYVIGTEKIAQLIAFGRPDGAWSVPEPISPPFTWEVSSYATNRGIAALPGGGIAIAFAIERPGHPTQCSLARVTP